ncbi:MAG: hypothetical protein MUO23_10625, partial [Anaerolineales bacterium]|nr:hypothetical protein [Anaerolineales bacterium]
MTPLVIGAILWLISSVCVGLLALVVHRLVRTDDASLNLAAYLAVVVGLITAINLALGLLGWLTPWGVTSASLLVLGLACLVPAARAVLLDLPARWRAGRRTAAAWWFDLPRLLRFLAALLMLILTARFAFLVWALPPFVWDALTYHLTNVAAWTQSARILPIDSPVTRTFLPANFEVFSTWFTVFLHHDIVVEAAGIPGYLIACVAVYALARRLGCGAPLALVAGLAYATTPALLLAATGAKNDPLMTGIILLMMALIVDLVLRPDLSPERNLPGQLTLLLALAFFGLGTKAYLLHVLVGIAAMAWLLPRAAGRGGCWRQVLATSRAQLRAGGRRIWIPLVGMVAVSLFLGLYWYGRNAVLLGNPFYPMGIEFGSAPIVPGVHNNFPVSLTRFLENLEVFGYKFGDRQGPILSDLPNVTGWGWIAYGLGIPTLIWCLVRLKVTRAVIAGFLVSLAVLFLSARASPWNMRYATWFPAVLCLTTTCFLQAVPDAYRLERRVLSALLIIGATLNVLPTVNYGRIPIDEFSRMLSKPALERNAASLYLTIGDTYEFAVAKVPPGETLGYHVNANGFIYPLFRADFSQRIVYIPFENSGSCETLSRVMVDRGTRWL